MRIIFSRQVIENTNEDTNDNIHISSIVRVYRRSTSRQR